MVEASTVSASSVISRSSSNLNLLPIKMPYSPDKKEKTVLGIPMKYFSLLILILQNSTLVIIMRLSRVSSDSKGDQSMYVASTAVVMMELTKIISCLILLLLERPDKFLHVLYSQLFSLECLKMIVPAGLYAIQNNLLYAALSNLDATTFQVVYQLKILTTALFSIAMLGKSLTGMKWFALLLLMGGVAMVQTDSSKNKSPDSDLDQNPVVGFIAVLSACVSSGFAGVYFEKILKTASTSLWTRNIQLGIFGFTFSVITMLVTDYDKVLTNGMFYGYNWMTWLVVLNQALGGLIVAMVVKYADNILKGFATSVSIVVSAIFSFLVFGFRPSFNFVLGSHLVIFAVYLYGLPDSGKSE